MTEIAQGVLTEIPSAPERPSNVCVVNLPDVDAGDRRVKLGMHTDTTLTLLRTLSALPDRDKLRVEARVLTPEQREKLEGSRAYRFFLSSRFARNEQGGIALSFRNDLNATPEEASRWLSEPFSPASLADEVGHQVGYFSAADLVAQWTSTGRPNDLLPLVGGINQFEIGSDTLSPARLAEIQAALEVAFRAQENGRIQIQPLPKINPYYTSIAISSLPSYSSLTKNIENKSSISSIISNLPKENLKNKFEDDDIIPKIRIREKNNFERRIK